MARMSAAKRIELGKKMVERWGRANCSNDRNVRFVEDMLVRLEHGKGLTPRRRAWYDSAVLMDPPEPKNKEMVTRLLAAADVPGMEKTSSVLRDFAYKLSRGWNLSEKQVGFMNKLLSEAEEILAVGRWVPSAEEKRDIEIGVAFCRRYDQYYLAGQPGKAKAHRECLQWLTGQLEYLDKWSAKKMMDICKGDRSKMSEAPERWPVGSLACTKSGNMGLVVSPPEVSEKGKPCISLLLDGAHVEVALDDLKKSRRKRRK